MAGLFVWSSPSLLSKSKRLEIPSHRTKKFKGDWKGTGMTDKPEVAIHRALDNFNIEVPSWGFANTGTRFGKFIQPAAAVTVEDKFSDAGQLHALTGACPTVALHVQWDMPNGLKDVSQVKRLAEKYAVQPGSINPNLFQDQHYKYGSFGNPDPAIREAALQHTRDSIEIATRLESRDISMWFADGSNYPGTANIRQRKRWFERILCTRHSARQAARGIQPFRARLSSHRHCRLHGLLFPHRGPRQKSWSTPVTTPRRISSNRRLALAEESVGGFHFNDRRYADDDLFWIDRPVSSLPHLHDSYFEGKPALRDIAYMIDQSHNLKGKIEADPDRTMAQMLSKAAIVDHPSWPKPNKPALFAESLLQDALLPTFDPRFRPGFKRSPKDPISSQRLSGTDHKAARRGIRRTSLRMRSGGGGKSFAAET
jgi:L-rhamnose isomerase/sugar isomerase